MNVKSRFKDSLVFGYWQRCERYSGIVCVRVIIPSIDVNKQLVLPWSPMMIPQMRCYAPCLFELVSRPTLFAIRAVVASRWCPQQLDGVESTLPMASINFTPVERLR